MDLQWQKIFEEYITVVTWSSQNVLAASSAAGEIIIWQAGIFTEIMAKNDYSVDCLGFSHDGQFLAAGGQNGKLTIWQLNKKFPILLELSYRGQWIDRLLWHPQVSLLAFSIGTEIHIFDAQKQKIIHTLSSSIHSSVLALAWHPLGEYLAVAGNKGLKLWRVNTWQEETQNTIQDVASINLAWSLDGHYLASANLDYTVNLWELNNPNPWKMKGFTGKIRHLSWIEINQEPILVVSSTQEISLWRKNSEDAWTPQVLEGHTAKVQAISFHRDDLLLASGDEDGWICLWQEAQTIAQVIDDAQGGITSLAWNCQENRLAAGSENGELFIWCR